MIHLAVQRFLFQDCAETVETVRKFFRALPNWLKPGVNERSFARGSLACLLAKSDSLSESGEATERLYSIRLLPTAFCLL